MTIDFLQQGGGRVWPSETGFCLERPPTSPTLYANAQLYDYGGGRFQHRPPLAIRWRARFSHPASDLRGTAGFGLWNAPLAPQMGRLCLPRVAWFFFGSPPLDLPFVWGVAGNGFKAACLDAANPFFVALVPFAPLGFALMRLPLVYRRLWPIGQAALRASEALLNLDLTQEHAYEIHWWPRYVVFRVDGRTVHVSPYSPRGRLGFVAWLDNQYAIVTPQGRLGWGLLANESAHRLWLDALTFEAL